MPVLAAFFRRLHLSLSVTLHKSYSKNYNNKLLSFSHKDLSHEKLAAVKVHPERTPRSGPFNSN